MLLREIIKAKSGMELPVPDFLNGAKSYLGEKVADRLLNDDVVNKALNGSTITAEGEAKTLVGKGYEELKQLIERHKRNATGRYVHFDQVMQLVDDGDGGKIWVSKENLRRWKRGHQSPTRG